MTTMKEEEGCLASVCPSFDRYSSDMLADIADRVIQELQRDSHSISSDENTCPDLYSYGKSEVDGLTGKEENHGHGKYRVEEVGHEEEEEEEDEDFEFAFDYKDENSSPISAEEIFYNGQIRPVYPVFDQSLLVDSARNDNRNGDGSGRGSLRLTETSNETGPPRRRRPPLRKLMFEERGTGSCSSSASDPDDAELDGVEPGTYCVWNPKSATETQSKSTGTSSSKRWKLRDLFLPRSQSDGKDSLVFVTHNHNQSKRTPSTTISSAGKAKQETEKKTCAGDDAVTKTELSDDKAKRKTMLPYRPDIVGLFHNVNEVVGRNLHPF